jgi:hypothetical protein
MESMAATYGQNGDLSRANRGGLSGAAHDSPAVRIGAAALHPIQKDVDFVCSDQRAHLGINPGIGEPAFPGRSGRPAPRTQDEYNAPDGI